MESTAVNVDPRLLETVSAPTNIAVIKYWGKDSVELNTPINSSVSCTLEQVQRVGRISLNKTSLCPGALIVYSLIYGVG